MLCVAFSRRMCCSRVWSVSTKPRRAVHVARLARDPAGHPADEALRRGEEAEARAAEVEPVPERLALAHADVGAQLAGRRAGRRAAAGRRPPRTARRCACRPRASSPRSSTVPRKFGCWTNTAAVSSSTAAASASTSVAPSAGQRDLHDLHAVARRVGAQRGARVRMQRRGWRPGGCGRGLELGHVARGGHGARALVDRGVRHRQARELRDRRLELEHHLEAALGDLGLVGRVRGQELRARISASTSEGT